MSKTIALRKIIKSNIEPISKCYYRKADKTALFPHVVFDFETIDLGDIFRDDAILVVDIWGKGNDTTKVEMIADQIEKIFNAANIPGEEILPTFYRVSRKPIDDDDKTIIRRQLKFQIQNYEL